MSHIKNMCLSGKLLKIKNYCKERRNNTFRHTNGCHGISEGYSRLFQQDRHKADTPIATVNSVTTVMCKG